MSRNRKVKGGGSMYVSEDGKYLVTTNTRNTVYVYEMETLHNVLTVKTVSNVANTAISPDCKYLAAKNTSGEMALIRLNTGEELFRNKMKGNEGEQMTFTADSKYVLDFDWQGNVMLLDCSSNQVKLLDSYQPEPKNDCETGFLKKLFGGKEEHKHVWTKYDRYSKQIYRFIDEYSWGRGDRGHVDVSSADPNLFSFEVIQNYSTGLPDPIIGISFCKEHNYFLIQRSKEIVVADKRFTEVKRIALPRYLKRVLIMAFAVSPYERYLFVGNGDKSWLFRTDTMELVREFDYKYAFGFTMIDNDKTYIISTWEGTYIGEV